MTVWTAVIQWEDQGSFAEAVATLNREGYDIISLSRED